MSITAKLAQRCSSWVRSGWAMCFLTGTIAAISLVIRPSNVLAEPDDKQPNSRTSSFIFPGDGEFGGSFKFQGKDLGKELEALTQEIKTLKEQLAEVKKSTTDCGSLASENKIAVTKLDTRMKLQETRLVTGSFNFKWPKGHKLQSGEISFPTKLGVTPRIFLTEQGTTGGVAAFKTDSASEAGFKWAAMRVFGDDEWTATVVWLAVLP